MHSYVHRVQTGIACLPRPRPGSPAFTPSIPRPRPGPRPAFTPPRIFCSCQQNILTQAEKHIENLKSAPLNCLEPRLEL